MDPFPGFHEYEVQERLGSGGMGKVYRAVNRKTGRVVALKVEDILAHEDPEWHLRERFLREARILQGLHHENLPEFYAIGQLPDGRMYIALELLIGRPLSVFAGEPLEALVPLFIQCARALETIAEAGVVHRDVSPENFFVVEVGGHSVVKLIDFGLSKDFNAATEGLTRVGTFLGKPRYSSPEQAELVPGVAGIDWRTDLYSFGLTMHRMLTGMDLFPGRTAEEQIAARGKELPREALQEIRPPRLRKLLSRMLRLRPEERPESFDEVLVELLHVQSGLAAELAVRAGRDVREKRAKIRKVRSQHIAMQEGPTLRIEPPPESVPARPPANPWLLLLALPAAAVAVLILLRKPTKPSPAHPPPARAAAPPSAPTAAIAPVSPPRNVPPPSPPVAPSISSPRPAKPRESSASPRTVQTKPGEANPTERPEPTAQPAPPPAPPPAPAEPRVRPGELVGPGPGVVAPVLSGEIRLEYPPGTREAGTNEEILALIEVDERGSVIDGRILRGTKVEPLDQAVLAAIRAAPFSPPTKEGVPVKMWTTVRFRIRP